MTKATVMGVITSIIPIVIAENISFNNIGHTIITQGKNITTGMLTSKPSSVSINAILILAMVNVLFIRSFKQTALPFFSKTKNSSFMELLV
ncbi:hypothetical protein AGMMS50233_09760 [Endomicrobiia bacterium]|nr:hypothetical protein AGMMS50233_09760 [Endomicrobiia bacterium]